jgi:hypothetical protein
MNSPYDTKCISEEVLDENPLPSDLIYEKYGSSGEHIGEDEPYTIYINPDKKHYDHCTDPKLYDIISKTYLKYYRLNNRSNTIKRILTVDKSTYDNN